ncbi:hypothetical protein Dsin_003287 [Dipteronia sinensis]|uniref:Endonuclease/exonuclease/phosphatase n=1 Tax=Dipteronia sinensis TaxID=43782 RepID=A0AAE0B7T5_9ROSI|nr:hypothetical protein Dsin_003287 [Dipteronia sinensis]
MGKCSNFKSLGKGPNKSDEVRPDPSNAGDGQHYSSSPSDHNDSESGPGYEGPNVVSSGPRQIMVRNEDKNMVSISDQKGGIQTLSDPWCMGGDFNSVLDLTERVGVGCDRGCIRSFNNFIAKANVVDIPLHGMKFTWSNNKDREACLRLDRFFRNQSCCGSRTSLKLDSHAAFQTTTP